MTKKISIVPSPESKQKIKSQEKRLQNKAMLGCALDIALQTHSKWIFINSDVLSKKLIPEPQPGIEYILVTKDKNHDTEENGKHIVIKVPDLKLTRMGFIKISVLLALSNKNIQPDDGIVFVTGNSALQLLDTILSFHIADESELLTGHSIAQIPDRIDSTVFEQALNIAIELASKGKEGKPIGTIFVLGDEEKVLQLSKQMIINPFKGYSPIERNILNPDLKETLREFSSLDGAFVVSGSGEVMAAGRYLGAAMEGRELQQGLGSRHIAASGITALTNAVAIVISESTGDIRIFRNGSVILEIEKPNN